MSDKQTFLNNKRPRDEEKDTNLNFNTSSKEKSNIQTKSQLAKPNPRSLLEKILEDTEKKESRDKDRERDRKKYDSKYYSERDREREREREKREREREREREWEREREKEREREREKYKEANRSNNDRRESKYKDDHLESKNKDKHKEESKDKYKNKNLDKEKEKKEENKNRDLKNNEISHSNSQLKNRLDDNLDETAKKGKFFLDEQGRLLDEKGNIVQIKPQIQSTLKININKEKEQRVKELLSTKKIDQFEAKSKGFKFFDPNLEKKLNKREKMRLNAFKFSEMENKLNDTNSSLNNKNSLTIIPEKNSDVKLLMETHIKQQEELNKEKGVTGIEQPTHRIRYFNRLGAANVKQPVKFRAEDLIPDVEWWDSFFLPQGKKSFSPYWYNDEDGNFIHNVPEKIKLEDFKISEEDLLNERINIYVQHPVQVKNEYIEKMNKISMPVFLTEKERKRIRRLRRQEKEKDKQEKIRLGLQKPDEPKLKFSNFMNILADSAVLDPSQIERKVRKAYEERYKKMMSENEKNKLTKEQKAEKIRKKFEKDIKKDCKACLFKITNLLDRKNKFKIDTNAQQLYLTGVCITNKRNNAEKIPSFIYVEGGPLALKKFKILLLRRIKWENSNIANNFHNNGKNNIKMKNILNENGNEEDILMNNDNLIEEKTENNGNINKNDTELKNSKNCMLVWEGTIKKRSFEKWKLMEVTSEIRARKILSDKGMEHYWNLLLSYDFEEE